MTVSVAAASASPPTAVRAAISDEGVAAARHIEAITPIGVDVTGVGKVGVLSVKLEVLAICYPGSCWASHHPLAHPRESTRWKDLSG